MPLDKGENYDKITLLNALMEQSAAVGCQREGMVRALSRDRGAGHSGAARETGTVHPRDQMTEMSLCITLG